MTTRRIAKAFNLCAALVGISRSGKSTCCRNLADDWCQRGGFLLVHDPTRSWNLPHFDSWPDYAAAALEGGAPRAAGFTCPWGELVRGIIELGRQLNTQDNIVMPMLLIADETSGLGETGRTYVSGDDYELITQRAHLGVAIAANLQRVSNLPETVYGLFTDVMVFRINAKKDVALLEERCDMPGQLGAAMQLEQGSYMHVELGFERSIVDARLWTVPS